MARTPKTTAKQTRLSQFQAVADEFAGWKPGREVLTPVKSVPTIFPQFDVATRVHGYPIQRIVLVHGPSNMGKTVFLLGMGKSFLAREHYYFHVDAEMTTPEPWVQENLGALADYPTFMAMRPESYEETAMGVRKACEKLKKLRTDGAIPEDTCALFGIDSLQKLVPKDLLAKLLKDGGLDPLKGRGGMFQAMLNSAWMKELIPLMYHCNAGMLLLTRESQNTDKKGLYDKDYIVGGGNSAYYDSSLVCRITRNAWIKKGSDDNAQIIGERHLVQIVKTKVGHKDAKVSMCYFHTSNGQFIPAGFDTARDTIELGLRTPLLKKMGKKDDSAGQSIVDAETGEVYGKNLNDAVQKLTANAPLLAELTQRVLQVAEPDEAEELAE